jgi:hypothetical protein
MTLKIGVGDGISVIQNHRVNALLQLFVLSSQLLSCSPCHPVMSFDPSLGFEDLDEDNKACVLAIMEEIMAAKDLSIKRRSATSGHIPLPELQEIIGYIWQQLKRPTRIVGMHPLDKAYLDFRHSLYMSALEDAEAVFMAKGCSSDGGAAGEWTAKQCQQVQHIPLLRAEVSKSYETVARELRSSSHRYILQHKQHLQQMGSIFSEELGLSQSEQNLLQGYLHRHDWSKFLMPLYWTSPAPENLLGGTRPAFSPQGIAAGVQTKFFDLVHVHEILEGSAAYGHHLKVPRIIDSASTSGAAMIKLLNNGAPDLGRWIERLADSMEASLTKRIIQIIIGAEETEEEVAEPDPFLTFWFTNHAPLNANGLPEEDFVTCMSLIFADNSITTVADCMKRAFGEDSVPISMEEFSAQASIYRRCRLLFA